MAFHRSHRVIIALTLTVFLCLALFLISAFAPARNDPFHSPYIDGQVHSLAASSDTWFHFDYGLSNPPRTYVTLRLVNGAQSGLQYELYAPEIISEWWKNNPTGVGMVQNIDCSTGVPIGAGACQSKDLIWYGAFGGAGTYYVRVINNTPFPAQFVLTVQGDSVSPGPTVAPLPPGARAVQPVLPTPTRTPTPRAMPTPFDDPYHSAPIDGQVHSLPAASATWFNFAYGTPGDNQSHPQVGLRLVGAVGTGVIFQVWAPEQLGSWWQGGIPVGQGTQEYSFNCTNQVSDTQTPSPTPNPTLTSTPTSTPAPTATAGPPALCTHTPTSDLTWFGGFGAPGTYYVRVVNTNPWPVNFQLAMWQ